MKIFSKVLTFSACLMLAACAVPPNIKTDVNASTNFAAFRSYNFMQADGLMQGGYRSLAGERFRQAIAEQMAAKGYVLNEQQPDLLVNFQTVDTQKTDYVDMAAPIGPGRRWGGPQYGWNLSPITYTVSVVTIDLVDAKRKQAVWQGVSTTNVRSASQDESEQGIRTVIGNIFAKYPFTAGH